MLKGDWFASVVRFAVRKPAVVLGIVGVLVFGGAALAATQLPPSSSTDSLVGKGSDAYEATERFKAEFGDEAVVILAQGELQKLVLTKNLEQFVSLEGCIGGNPPKEGGAEALAKLPKPCQELSELKPARAVYGPGTFINTAIGGATDFLATKTGQIKQAGDAARQASKDARRLAGQAGATRAGRREPRAAGGAGRAAAPLPPLQHRQPAVARVHRRARVRRLEGRRRAEAAVRVPVPVQGRGDDHRAPAAGPDRRRSARARSS